MCCSVLKIIIRLHSTWDMFGPADIDHQLSVSQVTQCGQSLDVALRYSGVRHGKDTFRLSHQQQRHHFVFDHTTGRN